MLSLKGLYGKDHIYGVIQDDPKKVVPFIVTEYKLDTPITELVEVDRNKINESNHTLSDTFSNKKYEIKITSIADKCKGWKSSRDSNKCIIEFEGVRESQGGRSRSSKKRPTARRRRSSKARNARKSRKSRTTRRR